MPPHILDSKEIVNKSANRFCCTLTRTTDKKKCTIKTGVFSTENKSYQGKLLEVYARLDSVSLSISGESSLVFMGLMDFNEHGYYQPFFPNLEISLERVHQFQIYVLCCVDGKEVNDIDFRLVLELE